jgi:ubiquinone/menaquinone biosynthesis C-methylase UbiE
MKNDLDNLIPLMSQKGSKLTKEEFHNAVNTVFHDVESKYYDALHHGMDSSLQEQFDLLADDIVKTIPNVPSQCILLDVGCGTGMSTDKLLKSSLGKCIAKIYLLDTSKGMLEQCKLKAAKWGIPFELIQGDIFSLTELKFDIILTCSVLHHIPNLNDFLDKIKNLQHANGFFIHLHDPNGDSVFADNFLNRKNELRNYKRKQNIKHKLVRLIIKKLKTKIKKISGLGKKDYIDEVNERLLANGVVKTPLTDLEIWSITDLHVENIANHFGEGISFEYLEKQLAGYVCVSHRSYAFFGDLKMLLPELFRTREENMIREHNLDGRELAAAWQLR